MSIDAEKHRLGIVINRRVWMVARPPPFLQQFLFPMAFSTKKKTKKSQIYKCIYTHTHTIIKKHISPFIILDQDSSKPTQQTRLGPYILKPMAFYNIGLVLINLFFSWPYCCRTQIISFKRPSSQHNYLLRLVKNL